MPRRQKTSLIEGLVDALSRMPWWARLMSFLGRRKRRELLHATEGGSSAAAIDAMSWKDFELLIAEGFRLQGFVVVKKGGASADGGVDIELMKDGAKWLVQVKHRRAKQVPVEVVRELADVLPLRRAVGAFVVTSGRFTRPAEEFASGKGIKLVNGSKLTGILAQARASLDAKSAGRTTTAAPARAAATAVPSCPTCSQPMVLRKAQRGPNAGGTLGAAPPTRRGAAARGQRSPRSTPPRRGGFAGCGQVRTLPVMQYVIATQDSAGARRPLLGALLGSVLDNLRPLAVILVAAAGASVGVWWVAELGRFWA